MPAKAKKIVKKSSPATPAPLKPIKEAYTKVKIIQHLSEANELVPGRKSRNFKYSMKNFQNF